MKSKSIKGRTSIAVLVSLFVIFAVALIGTVFYRLRSELRRPLVTALAFRWPDAFDLVSLPTATRFDFPLGSENGALVYNAQPFTQNKHLGDDLNGIGGENSDLGDPIYAVADGRVLFAHEGGPGWGKIIILIHAYRENGERKYVQSYYAHIERMFVAPPQIVRRGQQIATVGTADGRYLAHLHFEMREFVTPFVGPGYRTDTRGWLNPSEFISRHRGAADDDVGHFPR